MEALEGAARELRDPRAICGLSARDLGLASALALLLDQGSKLLLLYVFHFIDMPAGRQGCRYCRSLTLSWSGTRAFRYGLFPGQRPARNRGFGRVLAVFAVAAWAGGSGIRRAQALAVGLGLVIGGALGNLIDRLVYGQVADFFHFYAHGYDWYVFNVADCAITVGVAALLYDAMLRPEAKAAGTDGQPGVER